jgi:hypothetical protein
MGARKRALYLMAGLLSCGLLVAAGPAGAAQSHSRTVLSLLAVASRVPSGLNATPQR